MFATNDGWAVRWALWLVITATAVTGCGGDDETTTPSGGGGTGGGGGGHGGAGAGWQWDGCPPGEVPDQDACVPAGHGAGIAPDDCAEGFVSDGDGGCDPILPDEPCAAGLLAVPGDVTCREIASCGTGTWGDIPVDGGTQHVDPSYTGGNSNGSATQPWTTLAAAFNAASTGAIIALAEGSYGDVAMPVAKAVRLWGRCPTLVEVDTLTISGVGTEAHAISVLGAGDDGVWVTAGDVLLEQLWVHDTFDTGVLVFPGAKVTVRGSLVERAFGTGINVVGGEIVLEQSVIRETLLEGGNGGRGLNLQHDNGTAATATVVGSLLDANHEVGLLVFASALLMQNSVIRGTLPVDNGTFGVGLHVQPDVPTMVRSSVTVEGSVITHNTDIGVSLSSADATFDATVIAHTLPRADTQDSGQGVRLWTDPGFGEPTVASFSRCLVTGNRDVGLVARGADVTVEGTIVRDTLARISDERHGRGVVSEHEPGAGERSSLVLTDSLVERSREIGVFAAGTDLLVEGSVVRNTEPQLSDGIAGRGISVQFGVGQPCDATVRYSLVEANVESGIFASGSQLVVDSTVVQDTSSATSGSHGWGVGLQGVTQLESPTTGTITKSLFARNAGAGVGVITATVTIDGSLFVDTQPDQNGLLGDGLVVMSMQEPAEGTVTGSRIESSARAGIASFGATLALGTTAIDCAAIELNGDDFGGFTFLFDDLGENFCGCGDTTDACKVLSTSLVPPEPLL
ncbi:MAG: hypothetical protein JRI68_08685 [Deltaproteobacteria bacterium]|nr:hypothetical protein [Deltaproteobacteria bacterium]